MPDISNARLPIYRLAAPSNPNLGRFAAALGLDGFTEKPLPGGGVRIEAGRRYLEVSPDGAYWFADDDALWNPMKPLDSLPSNADAASRGLGLLNHLSLIPRSGGDATITAEVAVNARSKTATARRFAQGEVEREECYEIDVYIGLGVAVVVPHPFSGEPTLADIVGPGTKTGVVFGSGGKIIGMNAAWRPIDGVAFEAPVISPGAARERLQSPQEGRGDVIVHIDTARLIYRVAVLAAGITCLCPFWLCAATVGAGDERQRTTDVAMPAADFEMADPYRLELAYADRKPDSAPYQGPSPYSAAISWKTFGASDANHEVALVLRQLAAEAWNVRFAWRDGDAWESDWKTEANYWVDAADLAYYTGHASPDSWRLTDAQTGDDEELTAREAGSLDVNDLIWGRNRLKWIMIGACGPLWDNCSVNEAGAFKWTGAFDGLRLIMGFGSTTAGFTREGSRTFELARGGVPLARAWLRAAREAQLSTDLVGRAHGDMNRIAAVLAVENDDVSALDDRLPATGTEIVEIGQPHRFRAIWTPA